MRKKNKKTKNKKILLISIIAIAMAIVVMQRNTTPFRVKEKESHQQLVADETVGEKAHITGIEIIGRETGTGPWDDNNNRGNDQNSTNHIVRSFDSVKWSVNCNMNLKSAYQGEIVKGGVLEVQAVIPEIAKGYVSWDKSKTTARENVQISEDGTTYTARFTRGDEESIIGSQQLDFVLNVLGAPHGLRLKPIFTVSIVGNDEGEEESVTLDENIPLVEPEQSNGLDETSYAKSLVVVTAAPRMNIKVTRAGATNFRKYFDLEAGDKVETPNEHSVLGRVQGYGITLQLYNELTASSENKGIKGVSVPDETKDITFDISFAVQNSSGQDISASYPPVLWEYCENMKSQTTGKFKGRNIKWNNLSTSAFASGAAPWNSIHSATSQSCYQGGTWSIDNPEDEPTMPYHFRISNYQININRFPDKNANEGTTTVSYKKNIGCFSAGFVQEIMTIPEDTKATFRFGPSASNFLYYVEEYDETTNSIISKPYSTEMKADDNGKIISIELKQATEYRKFQTFHRHDTPVGSLTTGSVYSIYGGSTDSGEGSRAIGTTLYLTSEAYKNSKDGEGPKSINLLQKFDDRGLEPLEGSNSDSGIFGVFLNQQNGRLKVLYAAKPDHKGWKETEEDTEQVISKRMEDTREEDLIYFESLQELKDAGYVCVGILYEDRDIGVEAGNEVVMALKMQVKKDAEVGKTYQTVSDLRAWEDHSADNLSWIDWNTNQYRAITDYPTPIYTIYNNTDEKTSYTKTEYDLDGNKIPGTHKGAGQSLLIVGATQALQHKSFDREGRTEKTVYNLTNKEFIVTNQIKPTIVNNYIDFPITGVTLQIIEELPKELSYEGYSTIGGIECSPDVTINADGTTKLIWTLENQAVNQEVPTIRYQAKIYEETEDAKTLETKTTIKELVTPGNPVKIGNYYLPKRQTTSQITVQNSISSHGYLSVAKSVIENQGEIEYHLVLPKVQGNDLEHFQLLDILPYNGDALGSSFEEDYVVKKIELLQTNNTTEETIDNSNLQLYYTNNDNVRENTTAKDANLANGWSTANFGTTLNQEMTAFAIKGNWISNSKAEISVTIQTRDNKPGDVYHNQFYIATTTSSLDQEASNSVSTKVITRRLSGYVWFDNNDNGRKDEDENYLSGATVTLLKEDGNTVAENIYGEQIQSITTGTDGQYEFVDMVKGNYIIQVELTETGDYNSTITKPTKTNFESKIQANGKTDVITKLSDDSSTVVEEKNVNAGFTMQERAITVHHYFYDKTATGEARKTTNKVLEDEIIEWKIGSPYQINAATQEDGLESYYEVAEKTSNWEGTLGENPIEVIYYYQYKSYTITWNNDDGSEIDTTEVIYGETPTHSNPSKEATAQYTYTFAGWSPEVTNVTGEATYIATYTSTVNKYTVTWKNEDGTTLETDENVSYGTTPAYNGATPSKEATAQYTYTFDKWSPEITSVAGDITYTATYTSKVNKYTITWKDDNGNTIDTTEVAYGEMPTHSNPSKEATAQYTYTFNGWSPEVTSVTGDATYQATYTSTVNKYTITWKDDNGNTIDTTEVAYGEMPTHSDPSKEATAQYTYTFAGWSPEITRVTGDTTYTARYTSEVNKYTITWKDDNGNTIDTTEVAYGEMPTHSDPSKAATAQYTYTFNGWSPEVTSVTGEVTYTASYTSEVNKYTITWKEDEGNTIDTTEVTYGSVPTHEEPSKEATAQYTYTFAGWSPEVTSVTGDATYQATYTSEVNKHTITWKDDNGNTIDTTEVAYGEMPTHSNPSKEATAQYTYTFAGWSPEVTSVTRDATYQATYTRKTRKYTITWKDDEGNTIDTTEVAYGETPTHSNPSKESTAQYTYTFAGWSPEIGAVTGEATYTATYTNTINKYTITWKDDNGNTIDTTEVEYGTVPTHAEPSKEATAQDTYTFAGWTPEVEVVTKDATYTATYTNEVNKYTITWKDDEGNTIDTTEVAYGETPTHADPSKTATAQYTYEFSGWSPSISPVTGEATYTATYTSTVNKYTITWKDDEGNTIDTTEVEYGTVPTHAEPSKAATAQYTYTFAGWGPEVTSVTGEATYTASYTSEVNKYTITWKDDEGNTIDTTEVAYGEMPTHSDPSKAATAQYTYTFAGWSPEVTSVTGEATYTASYTSEVNKYTITWKDDEGNTIDTTEVAYGTVPTHEEPSKAATAQYTYTFTGWSPEVTGVTGEVTYTATYRRTTRKYTITFMDRGEVKKTEEVEYGNSATAPNIERKGYTLSWDQAFDDVNEELTVNAIWTVRSDYTYYVHYYKEGTEEKIHESKEIKNQTYATTVTEEAEEITGYHVTGETSKTITIDENNQAIEFYYSKNSYQYTIKFVEKNHEDHVLKTVTNTALYEEEIPVTGEIIAGYKYESRSTNKITVSSDESSNIAYVYYTKKTGLSYTVKFIDVETRNAERPVELIDPIVKDGKTYGEKVLAEEEVTAAAEIKGLEKYQFIEASSSEITISDREDTNELTLYYQKKTGKIIIRYVNEITKKEIYPRVEKTGKVDTTYSIAQNDLPEVEGYELDATKLPTNTTGTYTTSEMVITYYYQQKAKIQIQHIEKKTGKVLSTEEIDGFVGQEYETKAKNFEKYVLEESPKNEKVLFAENTTKVTYYYSRLSQGVIEKHINMGTNEIIETKTYTGKAGDSYDIKSKNFKGYELVENKLPQNAKGIMTEEVIEVVYYYQYNTAVKVKYVDAETGKEIAKSETTKGYEGEKYSFKVKTIEGYRIVTSPSNETGKMTKDTIEVIYLYQKSQQTIPAQDKEDAKGSEVQKSEPKDTTIAQGKMPQTGDNKVIYAIVIISVIGIIAFIRIRNFKDIK